MTTGNFDGRVVIMFSVLTEAREIMLHSSELTINYVSLRNEKHDNVEITSLSLDSDEQLLNIKISKEIIGDYYLDIHYNGRLSRTMDGFYLHKLRTGETLAASRFNPNKARMAFPCFDEPQFKATFDISLQKPKRYIALSNMKEISRTPDSRKTENVEFEKNLLMPTYLLCFVIADFGYKETHIRLEEGKHLPLRIYSNKKMLHMTETALNTGKKVFENIINYHQIPYPLQKLDIAAIPDYKPLGTGNWGLILMNENLLQIDTNKTTTRNKMEMITAFAHVMPLIWFENLVTVEWWDHLWLNEGVALFLKWKILEVLKPKVSENRFLLLLHSALRADAASQSPPLKREVVSPDQLSHAYVSSAAIKTVVVLRMIEVLTGVEYFRRGVTSYLKMFQFSTTIAKDFFDSIEPHFHHNYPKLNFTQFVETWTSHPGYPLLIVTRSDESRRKFYISQKRFFTENSTHSMNNSHSWFVPITLTTVNGPKKDIIWFSNTEDDVEITLNEGEAWFKLNNEQRGFYRVTYPKDIWRTLIFLLNLGSKQLSTADRANLLDDVFELAEAGVVTYDLVLNAVSYLIIEEELIPWEVAAYIFRNLKLRLWNVDSVVDLCKVFQELIEPMYNKHSWTNGTTANLHDGFERMVILSLAGAIEMPDAEINANRILNLWMTGYDVKEQYHIEPDLRDIVFHYGMKHANLTQWNILWTIYLLNTTDDRKTLLQPLSAPEDTAILSHYVKVAWNKILDEDFIDVLTYVSRNPTGTSLVWDYVRENWRKLLIRYPNGNAKLANLILEITKTFDTTFFLDEVKQFFKDYRNAGVTDSIRAEALDAIEKNINWAETNLPVIQKWFYNRAMERNTTVAYLTEVTENSLQY